MPGTLTDERITGFDVWHCSIPVTGRRDHGIGSVAGTVEVVILRLSSEGGYWGFGEASPWTVFTGTPEASFAALDRYFRPLVIGKRVSDHAQIMAEAQAAVVHCTEAKAALETALAHLAGTHMIGATEQITLGCEFYQARYFLTEDLLAESFPISNGHVQVPDGPGLGFEPDIDKVRKFAFRCSTERAA